MTDHTFNVAQAEQVSGTQAEMLELAAEFEGEAKAHAAIGDKSEKTKCLRAAYALRTLAAQPPVDADAMEVFDHAYNLVFAKCRDVRKAQIAGVHAAIVAAYDVMTPPPRSSAGSATPLEKLVEFGAYRGVIERTRISKMHSVDGDDDGNPVYVVGRQHATAIVRALNEAGYSIVPAEPQSAPLPVDVIDSMPHPYRPASTELERKSILRRLELEGEAAISNILFQSALALPGEGSFSGTLWTIGEWIKTRHPSSSVSRPQSRSGE